MRILLIRHGESVLNANKQNTGAIPDHALPLTDKGITQAKMAGIKLSEFIEQNNIDKNNIRMWVSPYKRTRQTAELINESIKLDTSQIREDSMLVELDFGLFDKLSKQEQKELYPKEYEKYEIDKREKGKFFARRPHGESGLDVEIRLRIFFDTIFRDLNAGGPENLIVVCHGALITAFIKAFCHYSHEWYYSQDNPANCSIQLIEDSEYKGYIYKKAEQK